MASIVFQWESGEMERKKVFYSIAKFKSMLGVTDVEIAEAIGGAQSTISLRVRRISGHKVDLTLTANLRDYFSDRLGRQLTIDDFLEEEDSIALRHPKIADALHLFDLEQAYRRLNSAEWKGGIRGRVSFDLSVIAFPWQFGLGTLLCDAIGLNKNTINNLRQPKEIRDLGVLCEIRDVFGFKSVDDMLIDRRRDASPNRNKRGEDGRSSILSV